jgi:hypothetical protein
MGQRGIDRVDPEQQFAGTHCCLNLKIKRLVTKNTKEKLTKNTKKCG